MVAGGCRGVREHRARGVRRGVAGGRLRGGEQSRPPQAVVARRRPVRPAAPAAGSTGEIVFGDPEAGGGVVSFAVVDARPPRMFSFRWTHPAGEVPAEGNSLLVTFDLTPSGDGTLLRMTETGFRDMGWEAAVLEERYREHVHGWDFFLPRLAPYVATLGGRPCPAGSTTPSGPGSATRPGAGCSTCCSSRGRAPPPR